MRLTPPQLKLMELILTTTPSVLPGTERAMVSELHADHLIAFTGNRYVVTGRGRCSMTVSGYRGSFENVEIQPPHRPVAGRVLGTTTAERRLTKIN